MSAAAPDPQQALLEWGRRHHRDLPWRRTRDPWAVLVSELMLQQTQVSRVVPRYEPFLRRFPTPVACAEAPVGDVVRLWHGLGYNRRAVQLHRAAGVVTERHGGVLPTTLGELLALPGIGPYTARAVLAFAAEADVGVVDVNAARVLARAWSSSDQAVADEVVPAGQSWAWNQAMLDLGATVCTRRAPACHVCPLERWCHWRRAGMLEPDPAAPSHLQSPFGGSDRQGRGRIVDALRAGPLPLTDVAVVAGWPDQPDRALRVAGTLVADGLAVADGKVLRLP